jgi:hypothetical protein
MALKPGETYLFKNLDFRAPMSGTPPHVRSFVNFLYMSKVVRVKDEMNLPQLEPPLVHTRRELVTIMDYAAIAVTALVVGREPPMRVKPQGFELSRMSVMLADADGLGCRLQFYERLYKHGVALLPKRSYLLSGVLCHRAHGVVDFIAGVAVRADCWQRTTRSTEAC